MGQLGFEGGVSHHSGWHGHLRRCCRGGDTRRPPSWDAEVGTAAARPYSCQAGGRRVVHCSVRQHEKGAPRIGHRGRRPT
jgi:hypothetical protein